MSSGYQNLILLFSFIGLYIILNWVTDYTVIDETILYEHLEKKMSSENIEKFVQARKEYGWIFYVVALLLRVLKFLIISIVLLAGFVLWGYEADWGKLIKCALIAEFILLILPLIKIIWFSFFAADYSLTDVAEFKPLSFSVFLEPTSEPYLKYCLSSINIFQLLYSIVLIASVAHLQSISFLKSSRIVVSSYGLCFVVWITFITFLLIK